MAIKLIREYTSDNYISACIPVYSNDAYRKLKQYALELEPEKTLLYLYTHDDFNTHFESGRKRLKNAKLNHPEWFELGTPESQIQVLYVRNNKEAKQMFNKLEKMALSFSEDSLEESVTKKNEKYFVGVFKKEKWTKYGEPIYDETFETRSYDEAMEFAHKWNMKGYYVSISGYAKYGYGNDDDYFEDEDTDEYTYEPYEMKHLFSAFNESVSASLLTIRNQLMNKLGNAFKAIGGSMTPKVTVYPEDDPDTSFDITTDGKNVEITPKYDGIPDTVHKKRGIAFMRAVNVLYDFIMNTLGGKGKLATESKRIRRIKEGSYDRYDPNVEADFMEPGNLYNDMPDLEDLWAANKGLYLQDFIRDAYEHGFTRKEIDIFIDKKQGP